MTYLFNTNAKHYFNMCVTIYTNLCVDYSVSGFSNMLSMRHVYTSSLEAIPKLVMQIVVLKSTTKNINIDLQIFLIQVKYVNVRMWSKVDLPFLKHDCPLTLAQFRPSTNSFFPK
jgi:hypothetical protein